MQQLYQLHTAGMTVHIVYNLQSVKSKVNSAIILGLTDGQHGHEQH